MKSNAKIYTTYLSTAFYEDELKNQEYLINLKKSLSLLFIKAQEYRLSIYYRLSENDELLGLLKKLVTLDKESLIKTIATINKNQTNQSGKTILHLAADYNYPQLVQLLLEGGANPNIADYRGYTSLMTSLLDGNRQIAKLLLVYGANPFIRESSGNNSFDLAKKYDEPELYDFMLNILSLPKIEYESIYSKEMSKAEHFIILFVYLISCLISGMLSYYLLRINS